MIPNMKFEDFSEDPVLLCSKTGLGAFEENDDSFVTATSFVSAPFDGWGGTRLVAVTDALAEWVVCPDDDGRETRLREVSNIRDRREFVAWVDKQVAEGHVRSDDCTVLVLDL
jgi:hypothetical protein